MALPAPRTNGGDDNRKESARHTIQELLTADKSQAAFKALLPQHFKPERMVRIALVAVTRTPKLAECHPLTLLGAFIECAALGLEPNSPLQHVHLLPFWNSKMNIYEVQRIIGYRGYIELGRRTGEQVSMHADVAYENDTFEVSYGSECFLKHIPLFGDRDRGKAGVLRDALVGSAQGARPLAERPAEAFLAVGHRP
jgi:recombination protein RecT